MKILAIAMNTFREARRDRAQSVLLLYAMVVLGGAYVLAPLAMGEEYRVTRDLGLAAMSLVGVILIVLVGSGMVQREIDRRTVLTVLAKPIRRYEFLTGKYLGLMGMVFLVFLGMVALFSTVLLINEGRIEPAVLWAAAFTLGELTVMTAVVVAFSSFASPALTGIFTLSVFIMGQFAADLLRFAEKVAGEGSPVLSWLAQGVYFVLPHLNTFNLRAEAAYGVSPDFGLVTRAALYAILYAASLVTFGCIVFSRREFK